MATACTGCTPVGESMELPCYSSKVTLHLACVISFASSVPEESSTSTSLPRNAVLSRQFLGARPCSRSICFVAVSAMESLKSSSKLRYLNNELYICPAARADEDEVDASSGASSKGTMHTKPIYDVVRHPHKVTLPRVQLHGALSRTEQGRAP